MAPILRDPSPLFQAERLLIAKAWNFRSWFLHRFHHQKTRLIGCPRKLGPMVRINGLFHLLINGVYCGYNPLSHFLLTSCDFQVSIISWHPWFWVSSCWSFHDLQRSFQFPLLHSKFQRNRTPQEIHIFCKNLQMYEIITPEQRQILVGP